MAITLNTIATVTTPQQTPLPCDSGWVDNCTIDAAARTLAGTKVSGVLAPYASNAATTNIPEFSDAASAIKIYASNLAAALANYPARFGPALTAISQGFQDLATIEIPANRARLAKAQANVTAAQAVLDSANAVAAVPVTAAQGVLDQAKADTATALAALQAANDVAREAGKAGADDPAYQAAYAVALDAKAKLTTVNAAIGAAQAALNIAKVAAADAVVGEQAALVSAQDVARSAQAAVDDLSNPQIA